ncbi:PRKAR1B, partial [Symbiodinium necroappetens]
TSLAAGDSFGELSILYKMPMHAEFSAKEDCTMYVIDRQHFTACFNRRGKRFDEFLSLLEEVQILSPLLASERFELACNAIGLVEFQPGERVLHQGLMRSAKLWYVIHSGTGVVSLDQEKNGKKENEFLTNLSRAAHFGERSLLRAALSNAEQQHASRSMIGDKSTFQKKWMVCYSAVKVEMRRLPSISMRGQM